MQLNELLKKRRIIVIFLFAIILAVFFIYSFILLSMHEIYKGISVDGVDIAGLNKNEAINLIERKLSQERNEGYLILYDKKNTYKVKLDDISFEFLVDEAVDNAFNLGRSGNIIQRFFDIQKLKLHKIQLVTDYNLDMSKLKEVLTDLKMKTDKEEKNAEVIYNNGSIIINNEVFGRTLDVDKNVKLIENHIVNRNFSNINLDIDEIAPNVIETDIHEIKNVLALFSTTFNTHDENRSRNINIAAQRINSHLLYPGERFSMNELLGPRTLENGYLEAPVIFKNELIKGTGGGVCQVTTTLYDAVLKSKLEIVERTHHSIPLGYVEPGQDATIAEDVIDFKFRNNRAYPICINAEVKSNRLTIRLLGKKEAFDDYVVKLKSEIIEEYVPTEEDIIVDDSLPDNEKAVVRQPIKGYKAAVYRETYNKSGEMIDREKISEDKYNPVKAQIKVNSNYLKNTKAEEIQ